MGTRQNADADPGARLRQLFKEEAPSRSRLVDLVIALSVPTILAEISTTAMEYVDAAMVGSLGAGASAAIGLIASFTWLQGGLCTGVATGFSVQVAQLVGAGREDDARDVLRQSLLVSLLFGIVLALVSVLISPHLPVWLGGEPDVCADAGAYLMVFSAAMPAAMAVRLCSNMLQCTGDMKTPSVLNILMCVLDVVFNFLFIFPTRTVTVFGTAVTVYGAGLGVMGAALGTSLSEVVVGAALLWATCLRSPALSLRRRGSWRLRRPCLGMAARIASPICIERIIMNGAQIVSTAIVAPLGTVAIAAHSLAITAEGLCYMSGYGVGSAATTLVGQSIGATRYDLARRLANCSTYLGMGIMAFTGVLLYVFAPELMALFTPDLAVRELGAGVLRVEAFAEPLFGASIVVAGALRGAGDTLVPSIMNLSTMWGLRITAAALLAPRMGLYGVWVAMCGELCVRGVLFLVRLFRGRWLQNAEVVNG